MSISSSNRAALLSDFDEVRTLINDEATSWSSIPEGLNRNTTEEVNDVIIDEPVLNDLKRGIERGNRDLDESLTDLIWAVRKTIENGGTTYVDHDFLDKIDEPSYNEKSLVSPELRERTTEFLKKYTRDLDISEWRDYYGEIDGDELYESAAQALGARILTYDDDFSEKWLIQGEGESATVTYLADTPGNYVDMHTD